MPTLPVLTLGVLSATLLFGTIYSVVHDSYLDTSDPHITHLPHHLHLTHYFATKQNILNVFFIKKIWGWTTAAFLFLFFTSPPNTRTPQRIAKYLAETAVWLVFTSWFFGPAVLDRVIASTGGECILALPSGALVTVPTEMCYTHTAISPATHPMLFAASLVLPDSTWHAKPRLRRGHDVSGHVFLLTMSSLFLADQLRSSFGQRASGWPPLHKYAVASTVMVILVSLFASLTTSVYFHTPLEKFTGFVLGLAGYAITQLPIFQCPPAPAHTASSSPREKAQLAEQ